MKRNYINNYGITQETVIDDELILAICLSNDQTRMKGGINTDKWMDLHPRIKEYLYNRYSDADNIQEVLYRIKNSIEIRPICKTCGKRVHFKLFHKGFPEHCSTTCLNKDPEHKRKIKETCLRKYGGNNPMCSEVIKNKSKQTCLEKYGVEYSLLANTVREKGKQTCLEKYGKEMYGQFGSTEYKDLMQTKYGVDNPFQAEFVKEKMRDTNLKKYGVEYVSLSSEIKEKVKLTCLEKYGETSFLKTDAGKEKTKQTILHKYGVEYISQSEECKLKTKETCLSKYGVEYVSLAESVKEKFKQTCLERYGVEHLLLNPIYNKKVQDTKRRNNTFNVSKIENEFGQYLSNKYTIIRLYKSNEYPFNCDFYIQELNLYVELLGTWTHGRHRYNPNDPKDILKLNFWKSKNTEFYKSAIETWTIRDPLKFETAEKNNLKYLAIYSCKLKECIKQFEDFINTLEK